MSEIHARNIIEYYKLICLGGAENTRVENAGVEKADTEVRMCSINQSLSLLTQMASRQSATNIAIQHYMKVLKIAEHNK